MPEVGLGLGLERFALLARGEVQCVVDIVDDETASLTLTSLPDFPLALEAGTGPSVRRGVANAGGARRQVVRGAEGGAGSLKRLRAQVLARLGQKRANLLQDRVCRRQAAWWPLATGKRQWSAKPNVDAGAFTEQAARVDRIGAADRDRHEPARRSGVPVVPRPHLSCEAGWKLRLGEQCHGTTARQQAQRMPHPPGIRREGAQPPPERAQATCTKRIRARREVDHARHQV